MAPLTQRQEVGERYVEATVGLLDPGRAWRGQDLEAEGQDSCCPGFLGQDLQTFRGSASLKLIKRLCVFLKLL